MAKTKAELKQAVIDGFMQMGYIPGVDELPDFGSKEFDAVVECIAQHLAPPVQSKPEVLHRETPTVYHMAFTKDELYVIHHSAALAEAVVRSDLGRQLLLHGLLTQGFIVLEAQTPGGADNLISRLNKMAVVALGEKNQLKI